MAGNMYNAIPAVSGNPAYGAAAKAFSIQYLKALYDKMGAWKYARNFDADVAKFGESVSGASFPRLTAVDVDPSTGTVAQDNTQVASFTVTINKAKAVSYTIPESTLMQSKIDLRAAFADEAGRAVSNAIDYEMAQLVSSITTNTVGTAGSDISDTIVSLALEKLVLNHVDLSMRNDLVWILPSTQYHAVRALKNYGTSFKIVSGIADGEGEADLKAEIDTIYGIPVFFRSDMPTVSGGKAGGLFYRDAVGIAIQRMPELRPIQYVPNTINVQLLTWALFGINLNKETVACQVLTA